jgi:hypothetical protein
MAAPFWNQHLRVRHQQERGIEEDVVAMAYRSGWVATSVLHVIRWFPNTGSISFHGGLLADQLS